MISDDDVIRLFEEADPARGPDRANDHVDGTGYLTALREQRSIDMTITESPQPDPRASTKRRWAIMGTAAAAAALVIGVVAVIARDDEPPAPADPPSPAPTAQPSEVEEVEIAEQFYAALNDRDLATLQTLMGSDAIYDEDIAVEDMPAHLTALEAWDWTWEEVACEPADAGVRCEIAARNRLTELTGTELSGSSLVTMTDGTIDRVNVDQLDFSDYSANAFLPFQTWVRNNHFNDYQTIWGRGNGSFGQTPESAALLDQHLTAYINEAQSEPERGQPSVTPLLSGQPQQTVVGDITWTRVDGTSLPTTVFAGVDGGFIGLNPLDDAGTVWRSADGIEWEELTGPRVPDEELFIAATEEPAPADQPPSAAAHHRYVVFGGGLMALSLIPDESGFLAGVELWTRADGADTWEPVDVPVPSGAQIDSSDISSNGAQVLLSIVSSDSPRGGDPQRYEAWSTTDGDTWEVVDLDASDGLSYWPPRSTDFGWMASQPDAQPRGLAVSADGLTWQKIPYSDVTDGWPGGTSTGVTAIDRTIFAIAAYSSTSRAMLVGQLAEQ